MLSVRNLEKKFKFHAGFFSPEDKYVYAVNGISFDIGENETYGLVGESGCGKSTTARMLVQMYKPSGGEIILKGSDGEDKHLQKMKGQGLKEAREQIQYVFQDPARSLNPRMTIADVLLSGYRYSSQWPGKKQAVEEASRLLKEVGLSHDDLYRRPPDFSGGQRQRISIARALIMKPRLLICDEVVSALDVSIQGQILNLLLKIKEEHRLSMLFISHDLAVITYICDRVGVMYRGALVEEAPAETLVHSPVHEYTRFLYSSIPRLEAGTGIPGSAAGESPYKGRKFDPTVRPEEVDYAIMKEVGEKHKVLDTLLV